MALSALPALLTDAPKRRRLSIEMELADRLDDFVFVLAARD